MRLSKLIAIALTISILTLFIFFVRVYGVHSDFINYEAALYLSFNEIASNFYFVKEPGFWLLQKSLYQIFDSPLLVWILIDFSLICICIIAALKHKVNIIYVIIYFLSFYSLLGLFNTYRQFIALTLVGWGSLIISNRLIIIPSIAFHWVSAIAILFNLKIYTFLVFLVAVIFTTFFGSALFVDRVSTDSGRILSYFYFFVISIFLFYASLRSKKMIYATIWISLCFSFFFLSYSHIERILLAIFQLILPISIVEKFYNRLFMKFYYLFSLLFGFFHPSILIIFGVI